MQQDRFRQVVENTLIRTADLLVKKGEEYAGTEDRLSNFKRGAALTGATPEQVLFVYMSKHYDSLATYIRKTAAGQAPALSEPIEGRVDDLINYCLLLQALFAERDSETARTTS